MLDVDFCLRAHSIHLLRQRNNLIMRRERGLLQAAAPMLRLLNWVVQHFLAERHIIESLSTLSCGALKSPMKSWPNMFLQLWETFHCLALTFNYTVIFSPIYREKSQSSSQIDKKIGWCFITNNFCWHIFCHKLDLNVLLAYDTYSKLHKICKRQPTSWPGSSSLL